MPITAWKCVWCNGAEVPLDHFAVSECGLTHVNPVYAAAVLHHERVHYSRGTGVAEVTNGLGCPREAAILRTCDVAVDPLQYNALHGGTAWHSSMENAAKAMPEMVPGIEIEKKVVGRIGGIPVQGMVDQMRPLRLLIEDWKVKNDFSIAKIIKEGAQPNDVAQESMYGILREQTDGMVLVRGIIWYRSHAKGIFPVKIDRLWTEAEVLDYFPTAGSTYTVRDLFEMTQAGLSGSLKWEDMPLVGKTQRFGAALKCEFCVVRDKCFIQAGEAPF